MIIIGGQSFTTDEFQQIMSAVYYTAQRAKDDPHVPEETKDSWAEIYGKLRDVQIPGRLKSQKGRA